MLRRILFAVAALMALMPLAVRAEDCPVAQPHPLTPPQVAMLNGKYAEAEELYRAEMAKTPEHERLTAGLVRALLEDQKVDEAAATVTAAIEKDPQSPVLLTALARVQYRQGLPWEEEKTLTAAQVNGLCYAPLRLALADYYQFNSYFATARQQIVLAHQLDPYDAEIRSEWMQTLPPEKRVEELKKYLAAKDTDADAVKSAQVELAALEYRLQNKSRCHLESSAAATDIPFTPLLYDSEHVRAWALQVAFNGHRSSLEIDTGASGLYINSVLARRAGLKPVTRTQASGIGDKGAQAGYMAYADSIKIGGLEFKDCLVEVSDRRTVVGEDGLIGMDVFSDFVVTLDFPWRKLTLAPLPPYPGTAAAAPVGLDTGAGGGSSDGDSGPHDRYVAPEMKDWLAVRRVDHDLILLGLLNQKRLGLFLLDTGSGLSSLSPAAAKAVTKVHVDDDMEVKGISGDVKKVYEADKISLRFGNFQQNLDGTIVFSTDNISRSLGTEISGLIGFQTLRVLVVNIDYRDGLMKLDYSTNRGYQHIQ